MEVMLKVGVRWRKGKGRQNLHLSHPGEGARHVDIFRQVFKAEETAGTFQEHSFLTNETDYGSFCN